jgi:hypothetical protein
MQGQLTQQQIIESRGEDWLLLAEVHPFLRKTKKRGLLRSLREERRLALVLVAVMQASPFLIQFSETIQAQRIQAWPHNSSPQSRSSVPIAEQSITICWEYSFHWGNSILANETKYVPLDGLTGKISINTPENQELIVISEDRASTIFHEWKDRIENKSAWHTPFALVLSLLLTIVTDSFRDFSWVKATTLKGMAMTLLLGCCVWLTRDIVRAIRSPSASVESFVTHLKKGTKRTEYDIPQAQ